MRVDRCNAVFLPADPPREGRLALWDAGSGRDWGRGSDRDSYRHSGRDSGRDSGRAAADGEVELALPVKTAVRRRRVPARLLTIPEALRLLTRPPAEGASASYRAWSAAALAGLGLLARGRLLPAQTESGYGAWRAGPLDPADHAWLRQLADAMPAEAHAVPRGGRPLRIAVPETLVRQFWDAIADTLVRTPAAGLGCDAGAAPFAAAEPVVLGGPMDWLAEVDQAEHAGARTVLRVEPPDPEAGEEDGAFRGVLHLRSISDPSLLVDLADLWDAPVAVLSRLGNQAETDLLLALRRGARVWAPLQQALHAATPTAIALDDAEIDDLLTEGAEALDAAGIEVLWPTELAAAGVKIKAAATPAPDGGPEGGFTLENLLEFRWQPTLDGDPLTPEEVATLAEAKRPLVRLRGRWIRVDQQLLARLRRRRKTKLTAAEALAAALTGEIDVDGERVEFHAEGSLADLAARLAGTGVAAVQATPTIEPPDDLQATLRPYQLRGLAWLAHLTGLGLGGCLADDMGLGKTVQLIALHLHRRPLGLGPTLVVCPTSLLGNWEREVARFAPQVPVRRYHSGERHLDDVKPDEIVLVTYGVVRRDHATLAELSWGLAVADEAQHAKNPLSRTARALRTIPAAARVALTGTPVENRLSELWAIIDWATPGLLGPLDRFRHAIAVPVERYRDPAATERLSRLVRPFLLRRRKSDPGIAPELPRKTETDLVVPLTAEQATLYEAVVRETMAKIERSEGIERRGLVLSLLTALKQVCNHPAQYLHEPGPLPHRSGKLAALDELLEVIRSEGESVLVFSQYVEMCRLLETHLAARDVRTLFLHGGVPAAERERMVESFQTGEAPVFLLSLKAGGVGLNLTRATHVVHYDRWWNPAVEDQATDRAYRIGQDRPVQVHRLITDGTLEDRIATLIGAKRSLAESVVGSGEAWLTELSDAELAELVRLGRPS